MHTNEGMCVNAKCAALCSRGRKSQDDGDFKTELQLLRKAAAVFSFPLPSAWTSFCSVSTSALDEGFKK